jgi:hypothetical protein
MNRTPAPHCQPPHGITTVVGFIKQSFPWFLVVDIGDISKDTLKMSLTDDIAGCLTHELLLQTRSFIQNLADCSHEDVTRVVQAALKQIEVWNNG